MKILIVGDTHGNTRWLREYIYPVAMTLKVNAIVQLGDFGAWEHTPGGVMFMNDVNDLSQDSGIPLYWLFGNHDKHSHTIKAYKPNQRGFLPCREFVFHIPQGHTWTWAGVTFRAFGGAYSIDKQWRLVKERRAGKPQSLWFPEEEMDEAELNYLLDLDSSPKDIILSHDKPFSARPPWNRKNIAECMPNQMRLERALRAHQPHWWFHGHLHYHYVDKVFSSDHKQTTVVGLDPDDNAAELNWKRTQSWALLDLDDSNVTVKLGFEVFIDSEIMQAAIAFLD